jgi:RNA polymerase sigma-70 factor (ECF subfamily)
LESMGEDVVPWLYRVALNATSHSRRSSSRRQRLHDRIRTVRENEASQRDEVFAWSDGFTQAFGSLRERDREVLRLAVWEGLDSSAAAAVLGCTPGTFNVRVHRARERLRRLLERSGAELLDTSTRHQTDPQADRLSPPLTSREDNP